MNGTFRSLFTSITLLLALAFSGIVGAQDHKPTEDDIVGQIGEPEFSPYVGHAFPMRVLWGDQHLHTAVSVGDCR